MGSALENNKESFLSQFVARGRFLTAFLANMTPATFVDTLNSNSGGALSQTERDEFITDLASAMNTRAQVLRAIAEDQHLATAELNRAFVLMQYFGYLRRNPSDLPDADYTGYEFWLNKLNQFNGDYIAAEMVKAFLNSAEYQARFN